MAAHPTIVRDVGRIFDPDVQSLPDWLFPNIAEYEEEPLKVDYDCGLGHQFPAFLRQICPSNTAMIQGVELSFSSLPYGTDYFHIYSEILRQHMPRLRRLLIGKIF